MEIDFRPDPASREPVYRQLCRHLAAHIAGLPAGSRLPPSRKLAQRLGLARRTVLDAYQELEAEGWTRGRVGSGTYVERLAC